MDHPSRKNQIRQMSIDTFLQNTATCDIAPCVCVGVNIHSYITTRAWDLVRFVGPQYFDVRPGPKVCRDSGPWETKLTLTIVFCIVLYCYNATDLKLS